MHDHHDHESAVHDAIHEAEIDGAVDFSAAMRFIPDEFHSDHRDPRDRFIASVVANARAAGRSAYTVALFAMDVA